MNKNKHIDQSGFIPLVPLAIIGILAIGGGTVAVSQNALPGDMLYDVKTATQNARLLLAVTKESKFEAHLTIAEEKIKEIQKLVNRKPQEAKVQDNLDQATKHRIKALEQAEQAQEDGKNIDKPTQKMTTSLEHQQEVLKGVLDKAPEQARSGLENAMEKSRQGLGKAMEAINKETPSKESKPTPNK